MTHNLFDCPRRAEPQAYPLYRAESAAASAEIVARFHPELLDLVRNGAYNYQPPTEPLQNSYIKPYGWIPAGFHFMDCIRHAIPDALSQEPG